jgi:hypothetical protein
MSDELRLSHHAHDAAAATAQRIQLMMRTVAKTE